MTYSAFVDLVVQHWVVLTLVLCPIVIVLMALASLSCEACGAPFGVFRRRHRTIDLCLRCSVLHDIRRASESRKSSSEPGGSPGTEPAAESQAQPRHGDRRQDRRFTTQPAVELGVAGHPRGHN